MVIKPGPGERAGRWINMDLEATVKLLQEKVKNGTPPAVEFSTNDAAKARLANLIISGLLAKIEAGKELDDIDVDIIVGMKLDLVYHLQLRNGINPNKDSALDWLTMYDLPIEYKFPWEA